MIFLLKRFGHAYPNLFVGFLTVTAGFDNGHDDVFSRHERQLLRNATSDDLGIYDEAFGDILKRCQDDVTSQERFRECDTTIGTVMRPRISSYNLYTV